MPYELTPENNPHTICVCNHPTALSEAGSNVACHLAPASKGHIPLFRHKWPMCACCFGFHILPHFSRSIGALWPSSGVLRSTKFRKLDVFSFSGEGGWDTYYWIRYNELTSDPTKCVFPTLSPEDGNRSSFRNVVFFRISDGGQRAKTQYF
jgi:hypothetical protein